MTYYIAMIEEPKNENEAYGVIFPDLEGCYSAADDSFEEAIKNATEALAFWFEDEEKTPKARRLQDIFKDDKEGQYKGMIPVAIPLIKEVGRVNRINISLDEGLHNLFKEHAAKNGVTLSRFLVNAGLHEIKGQ